MLKILDESPSINGENEFNGQKNIFDLLNTNNQQAISTPNPLEDLFGNILPDNQSGHGKLIYDDYYYEDFVVSDINSCIPSMTVMDKNGLHITFRFERQDEILLIHLQATNSANTPIINFVFKAAVPKVTKNKISPFVFKYISIF